MSCSVDVPFGDDERRRYAEHIARQIQASGRSRYHNEVSCSLCRPRLFTPEFTARKRRRRARHSDAKAGSEPDCAENQAYQRRLGTNAPGDTPADQSRGGRRGSAPQAAETTPGTSMLRVKGMFTRIFACFQGLLAFHSKFKLANAKSQQNNEGSENRSAQKHSATTVSSKLTAESARSDKQPASLPLMSGDARLDGYSTPSPSDVQLDTHSAPPSVTHSDSYSVPPPIVVQPDAYGASVSSIVQPDAFGTSSVHIVSRMPCEL